MKNMKAKSPSSAPLLTSLSTEANSREEKGRDHHSKGSNKRHQHTTRTTAPLTHNNTTRPPHHHSSTRRSVPIPHQRPCLPSCLLILVCCLLLLVSFSVLSVLPHICPNKRPSVRLFCVILEYRDEKLIERGSRWFLPQFPHHQAVNRERVVTFSRTFFPDPSVFKSYHELRNIGDNFSEGIISEVGLLIC